MSNSLDTSSANLPISLFPISASKGLSITAGSGSGASSLMSVAIGSLIFSVIFLIFLTSEATFLSFNSTSLFSDKLDSAFSKSLLD